MTFQDICYLSATEGLDRLRRRELSPVELMQAITCTFRGQVFEF